MQKLKVIENSILKEEDISIIQKWFKFFNNLNKKYMFFL